MTGHESSTRETVDTAWTDRLRGHRPLIVVAAGAAALILSGLWMTAASPSDSGQAVRADDPQCAALARVVAGRSHSILDGQRYRATERRAYGLCAADPSAFRRIVRGY